MHMHKAKEILIFGWPYFCFENVMKKAGGPDKRSRASGESVQNLWIFGFHKYYCVSGISKPIFQRKLVI